MQFLRATHLATWGSEFFVASQVLGFWPILISVDRKCGANVGKPFPLIRSDKKKQGPLTQNQDQCCQILRLFVILRLGSLLTSKINNLHKENAFVASTKKR